MNNAGNQFNKQLVWDYWQALHAANSGAVNPVLGRYLSENHRWHGFEPVGAINGTEDLGAGFWEPLFASFPDLERRTWLFFGGKSNGRIDGRNDGKMWVTGTGILTGTFANDYLSIPATGSGVNIRWGEFCRIEDSHVVETYFLIDMIDLIQQAGYQVLPTSRGRDHVYPPPAANDGILLGEQACADSDYSLDHIRRFIFEGLNAYDENNLESMGMADYFHPDVRWYGPGGIGACFGFTEFETLHQAPWLHAFPNRSVQDLDALFAEGPYSGAPGWNGVLATHEGEYLGHAATGNSLGVNGLDWWKRDGERYIENWVFVDMLHLFRQMNVDLLARLEELKAGKT